MEIITSPWPWYITGPLIGLMVPLLLIFGNKMFGISSSLRHICAACVPTKNIYFKYDWKKEAWNLIFAAGIIGGGFIAWNYLTEVIHHDIGNDNQGAFEKVYFLNPIYNGLSDDAVAMFHQWGLFTQHEISPEQIFDWNNLVNPIGWYFMLIGGFFVGFGTRYANGCTSGHSIMGISQLSPSSLIATIGFFIGGLICSWFIVPFLLEIF